MPQAIKGQTPKIGEHKVKHQELDKTASEVLRVAWYKKSQETLTLTECQ